MSGRFKGRNVARIKSHNREIVFDVIRRYGPVTKPEIASVTGLTRAAASKITDELVSMGFVSKVGLAESNGGRPAELFQVSGDSYFALAIDLSFAVPKVVAMSANGEILEHHNVSLDNSTDVDDLIRSLGEVFETTSGAKRGCVGIGVVVPGLFDIRSGTVMQAYALNWRDVPLKALLQKVFDLPVVVEKETCAGLLAEEYYGTMKRVENSIYVYVGTGIGSAIMVDGKLHRGSTSMAGELGHIVIDENGPLCRCGQRGCLEAFVSGPRVVEMAKEAANQHPNGILAELLRTANGVLFPQSVVYEAAERGAPEAVRIVRKVGDYIARAIGGVIMMVNPEVVFIGGEVYTGRRLLVESIQQALPQYGLQIAIASTSILPASFDFRQGMMGVTAELLKASVR